MRKGFWPVAMAAIVLALTCGARTASADVATIFLTNSNVAPTVSPPSYYVKVTVDRTDTVHATVTFVTTGSVYPGLLMINEAMALNVNGSFEVTATSGFVPIDNCGSDTQVGNACVDYSTGNVSAFGTFNVSLRNKGGTGDGVAAVSATLHRTSGSWASANDVLFDNNDGAAAVSHVSFVNNGCTGFVSDGGTSSPNPTVPCRTATTVPEPNSFLLLASGLFGLTRFAARRSGGS